MHNGDIMKVMKNERPNNKSSDLFLFFFRFISYVANTKCTLIVSYFFYYPSFLHFLQIYTENFLNKNMKAIIINLIFKNETYGMPGWLSS